MQTVTHTHTRGQPVDNPLLSSFKISYNVVSLFPVLLLALHLSVFFASVDQLTEGALR